MFREQLHTLAKEVLMPLEEADARVGFLAGAVFESLMEAALEESRRMNTDRIDLILKRAYNMYRHPLLVTLDATRPESKQVKDLKDIGIQMVVGRLGVNLTMEVMRMLEATRQRVANPEAAAASDLQGAISYPYSEGLD
jgi:hypothetical protein